MMEVSALQQMLSRFRQLQEDLQRQVNSVTVEASAGGGMVTVKMNGQKQIVDVRIEPDVFASKDQENLTGGIPGIAGMKIPGLF
jgi:nucleoid-associated protein EbfC